MAIRKFHWSSVHDCVMHETDGLGNTLVEYTHEPSPYGPLISENRGGDEYVHHYDALGSTTMLTDETESVSDTFTYDAWGKEVSRTGTTETPYRWVGRWGYQFDESTESYYVRVRVYQPTIARWVSIDQFYNDNELNKYAFAYNDSVSLLDPSGAIPIRDISMIVTAMSMTRTVSPCSKNKQKCIDEMLKIMKAFFESHKNCFMRSHTPGLATLEENECRQDINDCLLAAIDGISVKCSSDAPDARGFAVGGCVDSRDDARKFGCEITCEGKYDYTDPSCAPCQGWLMDQSYIVIVSGKPHDVWPTAGDINTGWCKNTGNRNKLIRLLTHEFLHHCVGDHNTSDPGGHYKYKNDICDRPDVYTLIQDAQANCKVFG